MYRLIEEDRLVKFHSDSFHIHKQILFVFVFELIPVYQNKIK